MNSARRSFIEMCLKAPLIAWLIGGKKRTASTSGVDCDRGRDATGLVVADEFGEFGYQISQWISVNDRLPKCNSSHTTSKGSCSELILLFGGMDTIGLGRRYVGHVNPDLDLRFIAGPDGLFVHGVTHWAELPKRPTSSRSGE